MRPITFICAYYMNAGMFTEQQRVWADYPAALKPYFHAIVTDDCSPKGTRLTPKAVIDTEIASLQLYRNQKKARWNWLFARNLGVSKATTEWVIVTDIDHVLPAETLHRIVVEPLDGDYVYRLSRVDAPRPWPYTLSDCAPYKIHPNTWLMTRALYDRIGGYDERLSGCYGTDGEFRDRVNRAARGVVILPDVVIRYPREIVADASTPPSVMTRKGDTKNDADLLDRRTRRAEIANWKPLRVTFPYEHLTTVTAVDRKVAC